jgi:hypothetical protein
LRDTAKKVKPTKNSFPKKEQKIVYIESSNENSKAELGPAATVSKSPETGYN